MNPLDQQRKNRNKSRRDFIRLAGLGAASVTVPPIFGSCEKESETPTHIVSLSFDDGFQKSSIRTAEIYEKYELSACINVVASAHENQFALLPTDRSKNHASFIKLR